ncbi:hypothetical protein D9C73_011360 [Collichthys lucidus]|uniref:Uncharacterized protein n=1 Tax=Collichthys lucidus TaxID=240159 RepID=A0A4U5UQZ5_COLLU|nr:hypothetical protein D9C73_011360 [Collichthys lucidus]
MKKDEDEEESIHASELGHLESLLRLRTRFSAASTGWGVGAPQPRRVIRAKRVRRQTAENEMPSGSSPNPQP